VSAVVVGSIGIRKYGRKGITLALGAFGIVFTLTLLPLNGYRDYLFQMDERQLQAVQTGVEATAKNFPLLDGVDIIRDTEVTSGADTDEIDTATCYYGVATLVIGSQLSEAQILDGYTSQLTSYGYVLEPRDATSNLARVFYRGFHEYTVIEVIHDAFIGKNLGIDLGQVKKKYTSVMYIRMVYTLPQREGC
jgi:hypothetical protein